MIVCQCQVVSDRTLTAAIQQGACSLAQLCASTNAGRSCGGCLFSLKRLLCEHGATVVPAVPEDARAAS
ncbi:MAG: (2Fe-2S)-binding protein [Nocardioidaceae bacterium]